jgi:hypothetical protein
MKKISKHTGILAMVVLLFSSCVQNFDEINTDPTGVSDESLLQDNNSIGLLFTTLQQSVYFNFDYGEGSGWTYQTFQNLNADIWSGYMASPSNFNGGINNQTYAMMAGWNDACWIQTYNYVMTTSLRIKEKCVEQGATYLHFGAINTILRVLAMSRLCDQYGPIIYSKYGESMTGGTYDSGEDAYKQFFSELEEAVQALNQVVGKEDVPSFANFDMAYGGDFSKWMKLANSLRLRLAMRIVKYDAALARQQTEAALNAPQGLITANENLFQMSGKNYRNPLYTLSVEWSDIFINASLISIMEGYEDARLPKYGLANKANKVLGVRTGIPHLDVLEPQYKAIISRLNIASTYAPVMLFTPAETYFLLAEAALRNWSVGESAQYFYEEGIRTSFAQWGASLDDYFENTKKPIDWIDPVESEYNTPAVSTITPKWDDATSDEERLEKIITQKWIAVFPEGMNAWAEWRRTGYPKLIPIYKNDSANPMIPTETGVRRLPYPIKEKTDNPEGYTRAVQLLGGSDDANTRVFWDINKANL